MEPVGKFSPLLTPICFIDVQLIYWQSVCCYNEFSLCLVLTQMSLMFRLLFFRWCDFQVKTETTADLNVLHEQKSKAATEEHERNVEGNKCWDYSRHDHLRFQISEMEHFLFTVT